MTLNKSIRNLIKSHYDGGKTAKEIYDCLNKTVSKRTIYNWINRVVKRKSIEAKKPSGRPRTVRTKKLIQKVKRNFNNKLKKSARQLALENNCDRKTIANIIHDDLSLKTYKRIRCQTLTDVHKQKRKKFACWIRKHSKDEFFKKIMFSDEKIFDGDGQINLKNDVIYAKSRADADKNGGIFEKQKYPLKVMVWCGLTFNGPTEIVVLPKNGSFNQEFYVSNVLPVVKRECQRLIGEEFFYQQDGATSHTGNHSMESLKNEGINLLANGVWPPNSPDLSPMDYFFWNEVSSRIPKKKFTNRDELITEIPLEMIRKSIQSFKSRCLAVEKANGCLIKNKFT
jgi:transposase